jgi:dTDP-4-amino-4,6-dideoxygalactose transaminase
MPTRIQQPSPDRLFLSPPDLNGNERESVIRALESNWITTLGPEVDGFEQDMCKFLGVENALALSSGTAAIHLALVALGVGEDDFVFCSDLTFVASANPIIYCGAKPVFIDSDRQSWNMDPILLEEALKSYAGIGRLPKAVVVVDLYGQASDYETITEICARYSVPIVQDAAEALGATYGGRNCGTHGLMGVLSFNGNKIITTSGGGMLVSDNAPLISKARHLATQAADAYPFYHHTSIGFNYRLSNILAALGRAQLSALNAKVARRKEINRLYKRGLDQCPGIGFMPEAPGGESNHWLTCMMIDKNKTGVGPEVIRLHLESTNIQARRIWKPMHLQPLYGHCPIIGGSVSEDLFERGLCLPSGSQMTDHDVERVIHAIKERITMG